MRLLGYEGLKDRGINYSRVHIWRLVKAGQFPKPVKISEGSRNAWVESEIDDLIKSRMAARETPQAA